MSDRIYHYEWLDRFRSPVSAEVAAAELQRIELAEGGLTPRAVVDASRPEDAPLHDMFEWDNERAADSWRLDQARKAISSLRLVVRENAPPVPAFASVRVSEIDGALHETEGSGHEPKPTFVNIVSVDSNADLRLSFLWGELRNIEGCLARTAIYEELEPLRNAAREVRRVLRPAVEVAVSVAD